MKNISFKYYEAHIMNSEDHEIQKTKFNQKSSVDERNCANRKVLIILSYPKRLTTGNLSVADSMEQSSAIRCSHN